MPQIKTQIVVKGKSVAITVDPLERGTHFAIRAECEGAACEHRLTVGPVERGGRDDYTQEMLQRDLDSAREKLAAEAEWCARVRKMMDSVT